MNNAVTQTVRILVYSLLGAVALGFLMAWLVTGETIGLWAIIPAAALGTYIFAKWLWELYSIKWKNRALFRELKRELEEKR